VRLNYYTTNVDSIFEAYDALTARLEKSGCRPRGPSLHYSKSTALTRRSGAEAGRSPEVLVVVGHPPAEGPRRSAGDFLDRAGDPLRFGHESRSGAEGAVREGGVPEGPGQLLPRDLGGVSTKRTG
jgi:hypothetical protein